jgi:single stranded DNA-binding protein
MSGINKQIIVGNLGATPELNKTNTADRSVCNLRICVNEEWMDKATNQKRERKQWFTVVCWGPLAENCAKYLQKGRQVYVEAKYRDRAYQAQVKDINGTMLTYSDGSPVMENRTAPEWVASTVEFLGSKPQGAGDTAATGNAVQTAAFVAPNPAGAVATPAAVAETFQGQDETVADDTQEVVAQTAGI